MRKFIRNRQDGLRQCVRISIICSIPYGKSALNWRAWAKQDKPNAQVLKQNVRKRLKTFENIRKRSKIGVKRLKIFENIRLFWDPPAQMVLSGCVRSAMGSAVKGNSSFPSIYSG